MMRERGLATAHLMAFQQHWLPGRATLAAEQALLVAEHARNAGDEGLRSQGLAWYVATLAWGPQDIQTIEEKLDAIEREQLGPYLSARLALSRSQLERVAGHFDQAHQLAQQAIESFLALGMTMMAAVCHVWEGEIDLFEGNKRRSARFSPPGDAALAYAGEQSYRSIIQAMLAQVYERLGGGDAAHAAIVLSDQLGATDDVFNYTITHAVRARLALADGDAEAAERWARSAVEHAFRTDFVMHQANAELELARTLAELGRQQEATSRARAALELYEAKGDRPGAAETQTLLDTLSARA